MADYHPAMWMKPLPLSWRPLMTLVNFALFWQLDFEMLGRSPGPDKQPVSSSLKCWWSCGKQALASSSTPSGNGRPKGHEDAIKSHIWSSIQGKEPQTCRGAFPWRRDWSHLGIILRTLWLGLTCINEHKRRVYDRKFKRYKTTLSQI